MSINKYEPVVTWYVECWQSFNQDVDGLLIKGSSRVLIDSPDADIYADIDSADAFSMCWNQNGQMAL